MIALIQRALTLGLLLTAAALALWAQASGRPGIALTVIALALLGHAAVLALEMLLMHSINAGDPAPRATPLQVMRAWVIESWHAPLVFCWRQPFRSHLVPDTVAVPATHPSQAAVAAGPNQTASGPAQPAAQNGGTGAAAATVVPSADPAAEERQTAAATHRRGASPAPALQIPRRGVLLIHGFVCNRGVWNRWLLRLRASGTPFVAVNLEPVFGGIDHYVEAIDDAVAQLVHLTGRPPLAVAHSMGGLALRWWWAQPGHQHRIAHAITLGSPHNGTWLARLAMSPNTRQMQPGSHWLQDLRRREHADTPARLTCFYSNTDNIVFPASTATLPGADNRLLPGIPHVAMVDDPRPWNELQRRLAEG